MPQSLYYVVGELQNYCVTEADRDAIGEAFEVFIGPALRGAEGQFFTPRNVVKMMVEILDPKPGERIMDPACGSGGFLIAALAHVWRHVDAKAEKNEWKPEKRFQEKVRVAMDCFRGIDKDDFLAKVCKAYMALIGDGRGGVFCANALTSPTEWPSVMGEKIGFGNVDVVLTNPPFGKKIVVKGAPILSQYDLGYKWAQDKETKTIGENRNPPRGPATANPFFGTLPTTIEARRADGNRPARSRLWNADLRIRRNLLARRVKIRGVVSMPESLFKTSGKGGTHAKTCVLFLENTRPKKNEDWPVFMADAKWCGHDSRGNPTLRKNETGEILVLDDLPLD